MGSDPRWISVAHIVLKFLFIVCCILKKDWCKRLGGGGWRTQPHALRSTNKINTAILIVSDCIITSIRKNFKILKESRDQ